MAKKNKCDKCKKQTDWITDVQIGMITYKTKRIKNQSWLCHKLCVECYGELFHWINKTEKMENKDGQEESQTRKK